MRTILKISKTFYKFLKNELYDVTINSDNCTLPWKWNVIFFFHLSFIYLQFWSSEQHTPRDLVSLLYFFHISSKRHKLNKIYTRDACKISLWSCARSAKFHFRAHGFNTKSNTISTVLAFSHCSVYFSYLRFPSVFASFCTSLTSGNYDINVREMFSGRLKS